MVPGPPPTTRFSNTQAHSPKASPATRARPPSAPRPRPGSAATSRHPLASFVRILLAHARKTAAGAGGGARGAAAALAAAMRGVVGAALDVAGPHAAKKEAAGESPAA